MKKTISILLAALTALLPLLSLSSCSDGGAPEETAPVSQTAPADPSGGENAAPDPEETRILPELPEVTYDGADFRMYQWDTNNWHVWDDLWVESLTGEPINDAVFSREVQMEQTYDVKVSLLIDNYLKYEENLRNAVTSGEDSWEVVVSMGHDIPRLYPYNVFYNLHDVPYLDFEKPWWNKNCNESFTLAGYMPFTVSDMTILDKGVTAACFFNKNMAADYGLGSLYDNVLENTWTIARMIELGEVVETDLDGNGIRDDNDRYGLVCGDDPVYMLFHSAGGRYISKDEDGYPVLSFQSEYNFTVIPYYLEYVMYDENLTCNNSFKDGRADCVDMFREDHGLFLMKTLSATNSLREMESDFGILPIPKYDSAQDSYSSSVSVFGGNLISVPTTCGHLDMAGVLLEAMAAYSHYTLIPAFYDTVLKEKSARDAESTEMLDIIIAGMVFDVGDYYNLADFPDYFLRITGSAAHLGRDPRTSDIASFWKKKQKIVEADLKKLVKVIDGWKEMQNGG